MIVRRFQSVLGHPKHVFEAQRALWDISVKFCKSSNFSLKSRFCSYPAIQLLKTVKNTQISKTNLFFKSATYDPKIHVRKAKA